jgi:hypothetical protein
VNRLSKKFLGIVVLVLLAATGASAENIAVQYMTPYFTEFFDSTTTYNGSPVVPGSIIEAYDSTNFLIGKFRVDSVGSYGFMNAYGDDPGTSGVREGAVAGETISFKINGRTATVVSGNHAFTNQALKQVQLSANGTVAIAGTEFPIDVLGLPGDTLQFRVGIRNDGDGLDFYGVHLNMSIAGSDPFGWKAFEPDSVVYANPAQQVYVYFSIRVATFSADTVNNITWSVYSNVDTTQKVNGNFNVYMSLTDVDQPGGSLPNSFAVSQNYPNPFNPTTTISFYLPKAERASIEVFNVLGQLVKSENLGVLSSGEHQYEFNGQSLSSGVYFYRVTTADAHKIRKMVLLK